MLKVMLVDDTPDRASALKDALSAMEGVEVTCTLESALQLPERVAAHRPDIVLIDTESPSRDVQACDCPGRTCSGAASRIMACDRAFSPPPFRA